MTSDFGNPLRKFKLVFLGEQSVGKTSLITRYVVLPDHLGRPRVRAVRPSPGSPSESVVGPYSI